MSSSDLNHTVTSHPLQDVDLTAEPISSSRYASQENISPATTTSSSSSKNVNKENWVKFDDDVNEGILGTATTTVNNNNNIVVVHDEADNEPKNANLIAADVGATSASTNRLTPSPLPPPAPSKRNSAGALAAAGPIARPRTPTQLESGGIHQQQLHSVPLDAPTPPPPVQVS